MVVVKRSVHVCVEGGEMWEASGDRTGFNNAEDGAARSQARLLHWRTSVSGRLNGCLNTQVGE